MKEPRVALWVYRMLLRLYPAQFRRDYEREVVSLFRRQWGWQRSLAGAWLYFFQTCFSIVWNAPGEHFDMLTNDLSYALRGLWRNPWFAAVAITTLALGVGVNAALFSVVKSVLFGSLPYTKPDQLVRVWIRNPKQGFEHDISNLPRLEDWRHAPCFEGLAGFTSASLIFTRAGEPVQLRGAQVTADFFRVMGIHPQYGQGFDAGDDQDGRPRKIVISHEFWLRQFSGDPAVIGRQLELSGHSYQLTGVAPPAIHFPERDLDFWVPLMINERLRQSRGNFWLNVVGRLRDGVTLRRAQNEMDAFSRALAAQHPEDRDLAGVALVSLRDDLTGPIQAALAVLSGAVLCILLICCANIAGMLSARAATRSSELAIRTVLGAGRSRVVRQLLTEAVLLFSIGGVVGIAAGYGGVAILLRLVPPELPQLRDTRLDLTVAGLALAASMAAGLIFGLLPALQVSQFNLSSGIRQGARGLAGHLNTRRLRSVLTVGEMALAMILFTGACLLIRSFERVEHVSLGYDPRDVAIAEVQLPSSRYGNRQKVAEFYNAMLDRLRHTSGIQAVGGINSFFLSRLPDSGLFSIEGRPDRISMPLTTDAVTPGFFAAMKIPLIRGRFFDDHDRADTVPVAIINQTTADRYWRNGDPLGKRITFGASDNPSARWYTIVGVVADTRRAGADQPVFTESYQSFAQEPQHQMQIVIRGLGAGAALQAAIRAVDPGQPVARFASLDAALGDQMASRRFTTFLLGLFAATALFITGVGLYGLLSYLVTQRVREFGIRVALGAQPRNVLWLVISRVGSLAACGLIAGTLGALGLGRLMDSLLFGVTHFDAGSYFAAAAGLLLIALAAAVSPAVRAVRTSPIISLRAE
ncbi:MAG TPA: ABC transporter permease [Bryobacteraceae bacterium]|nr:ABC transporter permease [Bryobacteraceae bacterium]